jgi:very-short-patch-repair endonuclease
MRSPKRYKRSRTDIHSLPDLKTFRKELRSKLTPAEARLWTLLKSSRLDGRKFRRQHSVGGYVLDFYCPTEKLAIELDGSGHFTEAGRAHDRERKIFLERFGINVIRFENELVFKEQEFVLDRIRYEFGWQQRTTPPAEAAGTPPS